MNTPNGSPPSNQSQELESLNQLTNSFSRNDRVWLRSEVMGTQIITRDTGRRLGVVGEVVVDIDRREVVALALRDNPLTRFLPGIPRWMLLSKIRQAGDVILVDSADSLEENFNPNNYNKTINCQVITESGQQLGRVLGFSFDIETGDLVTLIIASLGVPLLGEGILSTWELTVEEIISSGPDRIIVYEGAEEKLKQLGTGLLEKLGLSNSIWEEEKQTYQVDMIPVENQLGSGESITKEKQRIIETRVNQLEPERELEYVEVEAQKRETTVKRRYFEEDRDYLSIRDPILIHPDMNSEDLDQMNVNPYSNIRTRREGITKKSGISKSSIIDEELNPFEEDGEEEYDQINEANKNHSKPNFEDPW